MDMQQPPTTWNRTWLAAVVVVALGAAVVGNLQAEKPATLKKQAAPTAKPGSLVAIADLHGDVEKAKQALQLLSVVDSQGRWSAEGITVVQLGDLVDRGPSSLEVVRYMHSLQDQALRYNSRLVLLLGNHELLNLHGDYRYVAPEELTQLGQQQQQDKAAAAAADRTASIHDTGAPAAAGAAAGPAVAPQHDTAAAAYLAGLEVWAALWHKPAGSQAPTTSKAATTHQLVAATEAGDADDVDTSSTTGPAAAAAAGSAAGSVRASVVERHQLLAVHGGDGPCATAFVHAGLLSRALNQLLVVSNSSTTKEATTASTHKTLHHRMHDRHSALLPGDRSSSSGSNLQGTADTNSAAAVPVGVVSAAKLQAINSVVRQALHSCDDRACAGGPVLLQCAMAVLGSGQGPVWTRQQAQGREGSVCRHLEPVLARLGVRRLVVGHTPQASGRAAAHCGGRLLLLDTGMSSGMLGSPAAAWVCHAGAVQQHSETEVSVLTEGSGVSGSGESGAGGGDAGDGKLPGSSSVSSDGSSQGYSVVTYADGTVAAV